MRCGVCGSPRLSPVGRLRAGRNNNDRLQFKLGSARLLRFRPRFEVASARTCLGCGTVFPCLTADEVERLDALCGEAQDEPGA